jgi:aminopeptidase
MRIRMPSTATGSMLVGFGIITAVAWTGARVEHGAADAAKITGSAAAKDMKRETMDSTSSPDTAQLTKVAHQIVGTSTKLRPGDVVVIEGGKHTLPLMEAIAVQAMKAGALPRLWVSSDRIQRARLTEVPEEYLDQQPTFLASWLKPTAVFIALPTQENERTTIAGVEPARLVKAEKQDQVFIDAFTKSRLRLIVMTYPTAERARGFDLSPATYDQMIWAAMGTNYSQIAAQGQAIAERLRGAKQVHITSPAGTDLRLAIGDRPIVLDAGVVPPESTRATLAAHRVASVPGGGVSVAPLETSATGVVVAPHGECNLQPVTDARYEIARGTLTRVTAQKGQTCIDEFFKTHRGPSNRVGALIIGLNPEMRVVEAPGSYWPGNAAGLVTLGIGGNQFLGGANKVAGDAALVVPITHATVAIDGAVVVQDGKLVPLAEAAK